MRRSVNFILFALFLGLPAVSLAQARVPAADSGALGAEVGLFLPQEEGLGSGAALEGFYEYYFEPRTSVRLGFGWANPGFEGDNDDSLRHVRVATDLVHNWEYGAIHPFAGAGVGIYFLQLKLNGESAGDSETKFGGTLFGGAEFFTERTFAVKAEARYHVIREINDALNPSGLALTIGVKTYF